MGRASREQAGRNREQVVVAASRLFRERGVEHVSIAELMAAVGLTPGAFYKQFASKDALVAEAFAVTFEHSIASWQRTLGVDAATPKRLAALVRHYFAPRPDDQTCPMLAFGATTALSAAEPTRASYQEGVSGLWQVFEQAADASGPDDEATEQTRVVFAAMIGAAMLTRAIGPTPQMQELQDAVLAAAERVG